MAQLPPEVLEKYEREDTSWCVGWSRGREKFNGKADTGKGSFYANGIFDDPAAGDSSAIAKYPYAATPNFWVEELPELEEAFKAMSRLAYGVAQLLVKQWDVLVASQYPEHAGALFEETFTRSRLVVGRLLHYYA